MICQPVCHMASSVGSKHTQIKHLLQTHYDGILENNRPKTSSTNIPLRRIFDVYTQASI